MVVYNIPCESGKVYIGKTGRSMHERIKEYNQDIQLTRIQTSARYSGHAHKTATVCFVTKFIDQDSHWYTFRVNKTSPLAEGPQ